MLGASPVALSLAIQARQLGYHVTVAAPSADLPETPDADLLIDGFALGKLSEAKRFVVVSTQGKGDDAALRTAIATEAAYRAFGSRRKMAALREKLISEGIDVAAIDRIKAPAGLNLGAITPEEIAMSILAEITVERRRGQRVKASVFDAKQINSKRGGIQ
jgi:xanthine dehydrogenase accessory factor